MIIIYNNNLYMVSSFKTILINGDWMQVSVGKKLYNSSLLLSECWHDKWWYYKVISSLRQKLRIKSRQHLTLPTTYCYIFDRLPNHVTANKWKVFNFLLNVRSFIARQMGRSVWKTQIALSHWSNHNGIFFYARE